MTSIDRTTSLTDCRLPAGWRCAPSILGGQRSSIAQGKPGYPGSSFIGGYAENNFKTQQGLSRTP